MNEIKGRKYELIKGGGCKKCAFHNGQICILPTMLGVVTEAIIEACDFEPSHWEEVERCPKCGRDPSVITLSIAGDTIGYEAECYECGLHTGRCETRDEAIEEWNKMIRGLKDAD